MHLQTPQPFRVVYDIQKNKYYRVNKLTGQVEPSYKTGKTPAKFDPDVTGASYLARTQKFRTIDGRVGSRHDQVERNSGYRCQTQGERKSSGAGGLVLANTEPMRQSREKSNGLHDKIFKRKTKEYTSVDTKQCSQQNYRSSHIKTHAVDTSILTLPKLHKQNSFTHLDTRITSQLKNAPSIFKTINNSSTNVDMTFVSSKTKENSKEFSFVNSMNGLGLSEGDGSVCQSRVEFEQFQGKLRKYGEIQADKLQQNNFHPIEGNDSKSLKLERFAERSLVTSILDESHLTLDQTSNKLNLTTFDTHSNFSPQSITKTQVLKQFDNILKQKASLLLLAKQCQQQRATKHNPTTHPSQLKKQSLPSMQAVNLLQISQKHKLKSLLQKQKQAFLLFNPKYAFKENPRLVQEQRERKINLKKLEVLYLDGSEKRFGRVYNSGGGKEDVQGGGL